MYFLQFYITRKFGVFLWIKDPDPKKIPDPDPGDPKIRIRNTDYGFSKHFLGQLIIVQ